MSERVICKVCKKKLDVKIDNRYLTSKEDNDNIIIGIYCKQCKKEITYYIRPTK